MSNHSLKIDFELLNLISEKMLKNKLTLSIAESCTGGFLSTFFTSKSHASKFFKGSLIAYSNDFKIKFLDIRKNDINKHGVVSKYIAEKMANNARRKYKTDYGLATTGYVEILDSGVIKKNNYLHAWVSVSSKEKIVSKSIVLSKNRLENIHIVSCQLLKLFVKEII